MTHIKKRSLGLQILLMILTFGFYALYWFYVTAEEMKTEARDEQASPALWLVLLFIPFVCFYSWYKHAELYEKISSDKLNRWILFVLWIVFTPAVWFIVQTELNKKASAMGTNNAPA